MRLTVTQTPIKIYQLMLIWKTPKAWRTNLTRMTIQKAFRPRDDICWFYGTRKEGRRRLATKDCVDRTMQELEEYITRTRRIYILVTVVSCSNNEWQQNFKNLFLKMGKRTTVWILQATNWGHCPWDDLDMATEKELNERNWITFDCCTK